MLVDLLA